ncbi:membrane-associated protein [Streptomyces achromogenes]|uniref:Membrane-associated protein n=1 Tax=Streptomyces achromogenes TaxID=67255 RepID=A0ABU0Q431_STRAH|nr:VTT domain-containing protein [Streptomyces achromogenes]MDQ0685418.1 membrane-associated protein [Streptomyces achromogenes]
MTTLALGPEWITPDYLISTFGLVGILVIVFAESGLFAFLPGDSLLFTAGLLVADGKWIHQPLWLVCTLIVVAAVLGDQVGYLIGKFFGPKLFSRPDSKLFKQENLDKAHEFIERYGPKAIVLARFVPIVRTFAPIIAGAGRMKYRTFITYNVIGGILWGTGVTVAGYFLGQIDLIKENVEAILVLIVLISVVPVVIEVLKARKEARNAPAAQEPARQQAQQQPYGAPPAMDDATTQLRRIDQHQPYGDPGHREHQGHPGHRNGQDPQGGQGQTYENEYYGGQYPQQQPYPQQQYPQEWQQQPPQQQPYGGARHNGQYPHDQGY